MNGAINADVDTRYLQIPGTADNAMYVGKDLETGELSFFNVDVIGKRAATHSNGVIQRSAPAYFPPDLINEYTVPTDTSARGIVGVDTRNPVTVTSALPYAAIARIKINWPRGEPDSGTAWMFYGDVAVTAAHCVYNRSKSGWATSIQLWVGMNGTTESARAIGYASSLYTGNLYISSSQAKDDWGVIRLTEDIAANTGYLGLYYTTADMSGSSIQISGYPIDCIEDDHDNIPGNNPGDIIGWQWMATGEIERCETAVLYHDVDTGGGQSGAPVLFTGSNQAIGIHSRGFFDEDDIFEEIIENGACRITPSLYDYLLSFRD